jgi:hypothetical protein
MINLVGRVLEDFEEISDIQSFAVLVALADATNKETMTAYPTVKRIAEMSRLSERQSTRVLLGLEARGWVQIIRRKNDSGANLANLYRIIKYQEAAGRVSISHPEGDYQSGGMVSASQGGRVTGSPPPSFSPPHTPPLNLPPEEEPKVSKKPLAPDVATQTPEGFSLSSEPARAKNKAKPESYAELEAFVCGRLSLPESDARWLWDKWRGNGFKVSGKAMASWKATASAWERYPPGRNAIYPSRKDISLETKR